MNTRVPFICLCLLALLAPAAPAEERAELQFDERKWKLGFQGSRGASIITEYILEGESIQTWTELLTAQLLTGVPKRIKAEDFVKTAETKLRNITTGKLEWNIISTSPTDVMYEWTLVKDHLRPDEQEIVRVVKGTDGMHIIHYATHKVPMTSAARQKWIGLLKAVKIVK
jgi:hypothetical protein